MTTSSCVQPKPIREVRGLSREAFERDILPAGEPVVIRSLVPEWGLVRAAASGAEAATSYLLNFDRGHSFDTAFGPPSIQGRIFYNADLTGMNFRMGGAKLKSTLDYILACRNDEAPPAVAVQSVPVRQHLPGFEQENAMPLLPASVEPRIWIGNRVTIAAHYDPSDNIACVAAGRRLFTLFPPDQLTNLYIGPMEVTPAGTTVSMVDFDNPDLERYPKFAAAMEHALSSVLEPGDAIYIPYLWWHHVRSLERFNILVNYWWQPASAHMASPFHALIHAMIAMRDLTPSQRAAWQAHFENYAFNADGHPAEHLPADRRGIMEASDAVAREWKRHIVQRLSTN